MRVYFGAKANENSPTLDREMLLKIWNNRKAPIFKLLLILSLIFGMCMSGFELLSHFVQADYALPIIIETNQTDFNSRACTITGNDASFKQDANGLLHLQRVFVTDIIFNNLNIEPDFQMKIQIHHKEININSDNYHQFLQTHKDTTQDDRSYRLSSRYYANKSMLPKINQIRNWVGDSVIFLWGLVFFLRYSLLFGLACFFLVLILSKRRQIPFEYVRFRDISNSFSEIIVRFWHTPSLVLSFSTLAIVSLVYLGIAGYKNQFELNQAMVIFFVLHYFLLNFFLYFALIKIVTKIPIVKHLALFIAGFYILLIGQDAAIVFFGNTVFEKTHLSLIKPYSLLGFISVPAVFMALFFINFIIINAISITRAAKITGKRSLYISLVFLFVAWTIPAPKLYHTIRSALTLSGVNRHSFQLRAKQIQYFTQNSLLNFLDELFFQKTPRDFVTQTLTASQQEIIDYYHLPLGNRDYPSLNLPEFKRVVLFTSESLSLDLLNSYNKELVAHTSQFYGNPLIAKHCLRNYRTTAQPTLQGLMVSFNSHPNFNLLSAGKARHYQNSFVHSLKDAGYYTLFIRSASKFYGNENIHFANLGFKETIGREEFEKTSPKFVSGWGASDRVVYDRLLDELEKYRDEKIFITFLGTDTHPLDGRSDYFDLEYDELDFEGYGISQKFLESVARHNQDMCRFFKLAIERNLYDENTLFIFTADHGCPLNNVVQAIPGYPKELLVRIPLAFISQAALPELDLEMLASQLDLAPSILHLLNLPIKSGYWGESLFYSKRKPLAIGKVHGQYNLEFSDRTQFIFEDSKDGLMRGFLDLANMLLVE